MIDRRSPSVAPDRPLIAVSADPPLASLLDRLFAAPPVHVSTDVAVGADLFVRDEGSTYVLEDSDRNVVRRGSLSAIVDSLVAKLNQGVVTAGGDHLSLHAAGAERDGHALLVAGDVAAGKSSLAVALTRAGWAYMTDEVVQVAPSAELIRGFAKPITLKPGTRALFGDLPMERFDETDNGEPARAYLPVERIGAVRHDPAPPRLVVLPARSTRTGADHEELTPTAAVAAVVANAFDIDRLGGPAGLEIAAALVARCRVVRITYNGLSDALAEIDKVWAEPGRRFETAPLPRLAAKKRPRAGLSPAPTTHGVTIGDGAVLRNDDTQRLVTIEPMPSGLWELLDGRRSMKQVAEEMAGRYQQPDTVRRDVAKLLGRLVDDGMLTDGT